MSNWGLPMRGTGLVSCARQHFHGEKSGAWLVGFPCRRESTLLAPHGYWYEDDHARCCPEQALVPRVLSYSTLGTSA